MYDAEFTPVGRDCTFQTLVTRFNLRDKALTAIGEVVHDIDSKDDQQSGDGRHSGNDPRDR